MEQTINGSTQSGQGKWVLFDIVNRRNIRLISPVLLWECVQYHNRARLE